MSIKLMALVWDSGPSDRTEAFVLLALADYANDDGECWPSIESLAKRTRMTDRGVRKAVSRLREGGWITVQAGGGRRVSNLYTVRKEMFSATRDDLQNPEHGSITLNTVPGNEGDETLNTDTETLNTVPETLNVVPETLNTVQPNLQEPPLNPQRSEGRGAQALAPSPQSDPGDRVPERWPSDSRHSGGDVQAAFEVFNVAADKCGWPRVQSINASRRKKMAQRLKEAGGIEGWQYAISKAKASPFCNGSNNRGWRVNIDFLLQPSSFAKLMEGNYDQRAGEPHRSNREAAASDTLRYQLDVVGRTRPSPTEGIF